MSEPEEIAWSWADERQFIETLVNSRFNFLIVLFGLVLAAAVGCHRQSHLQIILWAGAAVIVPVSFTVAGAQWKLDHILKRIRRQRPDNPIAAVSEAGRHLSLRWMIGYLIPFECCLGVLAGAILASTNYLTVGL